MEKMWNKKMTAKKPRGRPRKLDIEMQKYLASVMEANSRIADDSKLTQSAMYEKLLDKFRDKKIEEVANEHPEANEEWIKREAESRLPGASRVYKFITERDSEKYIIPKDPPWSLGNNNTVPIDMIPVVIEIGRLELEGAEQAAHSGKDKELKQDFGISVLEKARIDVRNAKWIAYLYPILKRIAHSRGDNTDIFDLEHNPKAQDNVLYWLSKLAMVYAHADRVCEKLKVAFDSFQLDKDILYTNRFFDMSHKDKRAYITQLLFPVR
jgi:hypothetical protein